MLLNLQNSFVDKECINYSLLNFDPFSLIGRHISLNFHKTLHNGKWLPAAFQKSYLKI
jgi:hypothetical protein